jgi:hypothetical protein
MDVRLPDGTIIRNVPEGTTQADLMARVNAMRQAQKPQGPAAVAEEVGPVQAAMIGGGRMATRIGQGIQQLYYGATGNEKASEELRQRVADEEAIYRPLAERRPLATGIGEALPSLAIPVAGAANAAGVVGRSVLAAALPEALRYGSAEERAKRGAVAAAGGAAGAGLGLGVSRLLQPVRGVAGASPEALAAAERIGFKPTAAQATQNPALANFENYLLRSPGGSGRMQAIQDANQTAINRAGARAMGENADTAGETVFAAARDRIGSEFQRLQNVTAPQLGQDFMSSLVKIDSANVARGPFANKQVSQLVDKGLDLAAQGKLSGQAYKEIHTELANASRTAFRAGDATLGQALKTVRESLDDAAKASLSKADQEAWDTVRKQWTAFKALSKSNVAEGGNISAPRAAAAVRQMGPQLRTGQMSGDLADVARVGEAFKSVQNPNSGQLAQQMLFGNPFTGIPMAAMNAGLARAYTSGAGQKYLSGGLLNVTPEIEALLLAASRPVGLLGTAEFLGAR